MCGIAEFRCKNLTVETRVLDNALNEFTYSRNRLSNNTELVSVEQYHGHCLCDPTDDERQQFLQAVEVLVRHSDEVVYSPNDYSDDLAQCFLETSAIGEAVSRYWPSLETPPLRITIQSH